jgi:hypothetical protein
VTGTICILCTVYLIQIWIWWWEAGVVDSKLPGEEGIYWWNGTWWLWWGLVQAFVVQSSHFSRGLIWQSRSLWLEYSKRWMVPLAQDGDQNGETLSSVSCGVTQQLQEWGWPTRRWCWLKCLCWLDFVWKTGGLHLGLQGSKTLFTSVGIWDCITLLQLINKC